MQYCEYTLSLFRVVFRKKKKAWTIEITRNNEKLRFSTGWIDFVLNIDLKKGDFLVFLLLHDGASLFIKIFRKTKYS